MISISPSITFSGPTPWLSPCACGHLVQLQLELDISGATPKELLINTIVTEHPTI
jgi:hypothetical protein